MLKLKTHDQIVQFRMGTSYFGRTFYHACSYLVDGLMIDTGCYGTRNEFAAACANYSINQAVLTHYHEDHAGNGWYFAEKDLPVWAHEKTAAILADGFKKIPTYRRFIWHTPPAYQLNVLGDHLTTEHYNFRIIHTPGHSEDHICLYEEKEGWLFSGDQFLGVRVKVVGTEENFYQNLASLYQLQKLNISRIFCSFGRIVKNPAEAIKEKINFMENTAESIRLLDYQGYNIKQITNHVLGPGWLGKFITGGDFCKENLVRAVLQKEQFAV